MLEDFTFSIVIPSRNEGEDIRLSIESALSQSFKPKEILVVDDSTDSVTRDVIQEYKQEGVLLVRGEARGCCEARNLGMQKAQGNVVVLLNADVILPETFLENIASHYRKGADYVLVESEVSNQENIYARFVEMQHRYEVKQLGDSAEWTEGFSCRREAAQFIGYIPGRFKKRFCRDWVLGKKLGEGGFRKVVDRSIVVRHKAPDNLKEFWGVRKARGRFGALMQHYLYKKSRIYLFFKLSAKSALSLLKFLTIAPSFYLAGKFAKQSAHPAKNSLLFWRLLLIQEFARSIGEWEGWIITGRS